MHKYSELLDNPAISKHTLRQREKMRHHIGEVAIDLFRQKGIRQVKMDDVSAALGISKRTLYELYDDKEDLLLEGLRINHKQVQEAINTRVENCNDVLEMVIEVYRISIEMTKDTNDRFFEDLVRYPKVMQAYSDDEAKRRAEQEEFIARGIKEGLFRTDTDARLLNIISEVTRKHIMAASLYHDYDVSALLRGTLFVFIRGICTVEGVAKLDALMEN